MSAKMFNKVPKLHKYYIWFGLLSSILIIAGFTFSIFGFSIFPTSIFPNIIRSYWESSVYGAIMIAWGTVLFLVGRFAFTKQDVTILKTLIFGISVWIFIEALYSLYSGVFFKIGVDMALLGLFSIPLLKGIRILKQERVLENRDGQVFKI